MSQELRDIFNQIVVIQKENVTPPTSGKSPFQEDGPGYLDQVGAHRTAQQARRAHPEPSTYDDRETDERGLPEFGSYDDYWDYVHHYYQRLGWKQG